MIRGEGNNYVVEEQDWTHEEEGTLECHKANSVTTSEVLTVTHTQQSERIFIPDPVSEVAEISQGHYRFSEL